MAEALVPPPGQPAKADPVPVFYSFDRFIPVRGCFLVPGSVHFSAHLLETLGTCLLVCSVGASAHQVRCSLRHGRNGRIVRCRALDAGWRSHRVL